MSEELSKSGLFFDDLHILRVLEPDISSETNDLKDECSLFNDSKIFFIDFVSITFGKNFRTS